MTVFHVTVQNKYFTENILAPKTAFLVGGVFVVLSACSSVGVNDYVDMQPRLELEQFFKGQLIASGVLKNRAGKVIRSFNADITATWQDGVGTLDEQFTFDDGEQQTRVWTLTPVGNGQYIGRAGDVVGDAGIRVAGNSMFLEYVLRIPYKGDTLDITIDDRMYKVSDTLLINESRMTKFGFEVGELVLAIIKK